MAVASAWPHASLHLAPDRLPRQHPTTQFFTGRMPFLLPNQQCQSTEGNLVCKKNYNIVESEVFKKFVNVSVRIMLMIKMSVSQYMLYSRFVG